MLANVWDIYIYIYMISVMMNTNITNICIYIHISIYIYICICECMYSICILNIYIYIVLPSNEGSVIAEWPGARSPAEESGGCTHLPPVGGSIQTSTSLPLPAYILPT